MTMPGRQLTPAVGSYRYGFNGKELDDNGTGMGGGGATYDYGFRIYNPAIAKFLSVDPLTKSYPWYTPYQFAGNMPTIGIDLDGLEVKIVTMWYDVMPDGSYVVSDVDVFIDQQQTVTINGEQKAMTLVARYYRNEEGTITKTTVQKIYEPLEYSFGIKPSATYDYTKASDAEQRHKDDELSASELWDLGLADAIKRAAVIYWRDETAPELEYEMQDFEAASMAYGALFTVDDLLKNSIKMTSKAQSKIDRYDRVGKYEDALADFNNLDGLTDVNKVESKYGTMYTGKLSDGRSVSVRPSSKKSKQPTLQIDPAKGSDGKTIKVRYIKE